jgi:hypothetical protein
MVMDFRDLKTLSEQDVSFDPDEVLAERTPQYQDAIPEEILDLLEEAAETYVSLAPTLPQRLQQVAKKEIEFLISLYYNKIRDSLKIENPQPPQNIAELLACCAF